MPLLQQASLQQAHPHGRVRPQRHDDQRDQRELPGQREHQDERDREDAGVGHEVGESVGQGALNAVHIRRHPRQDLARPGARIETHRESLQVIVQRRAQLLHYALPDGLVDIAL